MNEESINLEEAKKQLVNKERVINILLSRIAKLEYEIEELNNETEILTNEWLKSQEKRRKAREYLEQPNRDNFDFSKARLIEILGSDKE